ncbi:MAG: DNA alkylation repair protein [Oscillospiraceae bacterium]
MEKILKRLFDLQDPGYRDFSAKLIPNIDKETIIGVRSPALRNYAKELSKDPDRFDFLRELPHRYFEENNLHASLIGAVSRDIETVMAYLEEFLPYIDNWATCDTSAPKIFKKYPVEVYEKCRLWIKSGHTYTVRFAVVTLLEFFLDDNFQPEMLALVADVKSGEYYINMAVAWYFSFALIKQYETALPLIESRTLSKWVQNKSIQKAIESYRISDERKAYLKTLKI